MTRRALRPLAGALILAATTATPALAAPGDLDPAFNGGNPLFFTSQSGQIDWLNRLALDPSGQIVGGGCGCRFRPWSESSQSLVLQRWNSDGTHDDTFGGPNGVQDDGIDDWYAGSYDGGLFSPTALAVGDDHRVYAVLANDQPRPSLQRIVVGNEETDLTLARYAGDGVRQQLTRIDVPGMDRVNAPGIIVNSDGKVLIAGAGRQWAEDNVHDAVAIVRVGADGQVDDAWGDHGFVLPDLTTAGDENVVGLGHQPGAATGTFVVAGYADEGEDRWVFVARFNADGTRDETFGHHGVATQHVSDDASPWSVNGSGRLGAFTVASDGSLLVSEPNLFGVRRFDADGTPDTAFGTAGLARIPLPDETWSTVSGLGVQPDGKIIAVGETNDMEGDDPVHDVVARFLPNGTLDDSYGDHGQRTLALVGSPKREIVNDLVMQADGKPVIGGTTATRPVLDLGRPRATASNGMETSWVVARLDAETFTRPEPEPEPQPTPAAPAQQPNPAPQIDAPVTAAGGTRVCASRRSFRIRLRVPRHAKALRASVLVNGRRVKVLRGKRLRAPVDLRGLPKGRFTVEIHVRLRDGRLLSGKRVYHTCTRKRVTSHTIKL